MRFFYILLFFLLIHSPAFAQVKVEKESRCKEKDVPLAAQQFINSCSVSSKIKWYIEENTKGKSYEAKFSHRGKRYSVEFNELGNIEDVEIIIAKKDLPNETSERVFSEFKSSFSKFRIRRFQIQYSGNSNQLIGLIARNEVQNDLVVRYELVVRGKEGTSYRSYEYLFSSTGEVITKTPIVSRSSDHLEF